MPFPAWSNALNSPVHGLSVGFERIIFVVQPPPSANCGMFWTLDWMAELIGRMETGSVVVRKSLRSLVKPRSATADTCNEDVKVNVAWVFFGALNGGSVRNAAIWCPASIVVAPWLKSFPFESVKKNLMLTGAVLG